MTRLIKWKIWLSSILCLFSCLFVVDYNSLEKSIGTLSKQYPLVVEQLITNLQWIVFLVPLFGVACAFHIIKFKRRIQLLIVSESLLVFAIGWCLFCIFVWHYQELQCARMSVINWSNVQRQRTLQPSTNQF